MKLKYIILVLCCLLSIRISAQTPEQARKMFSEGQYHQAKAAFENFLKSQPNNASFNFYYGVCCIKTGEPELAVKPLKIAVQRKAVNANLYLGQAYEKLYCFEDAVKAYEEEIKILNQKKQQPSQELVTLLERSKQGVRMLKGVEKVCFIDSFVTNKKKFLESFKLSEESGKLYAYNDFFKEKGNNPGIVYETELKNKIYYSESGEDNTLNILSKNKLLKEWSEGTPLPGSVNDSANANYPYVLADGITLYYASDATTSIGGYDIYVTRYNTSTDTYLVPENIGMPFNSPANDYMYVIDEFSNLGWFATDRNQPEGKICIYVFIPNTSKQIYDAEEMAPEQIRRLAQLHSIRDTWKEPEVVEAARKRLEAVINQPTRQKTEYDFTFIINDRLTYHHWDDFASSQALQQFRAYVLLEKDYTQMSKRLSNQREQYARANEADKARSTGAILDLEKRVKDMYKELQTMAVKVRNLEINHINK